jgi:hypothetical protein
LRHISRLIYLAVAGASDFPHSKHDEFDRGVINPQKGHILCDAKPRDRGAAVANNFDTDPLTLANLLRRRSRNRLKLSICKSPPVNHLAYLKLSGKRTGLMRQRTITKKLAVRNHAKQNNDTPRLVILCKIAHLQNLAKQTMSSESQREKSADWRDGRAK